MNADLDAFLTRAQAVLVGELNGASLEDKASFGLRAEAKASFELQTEAKASFGLQGAGSNFWDESQRRVHVGVDLGTAYTVLVVLDEQMQPLAGEYRFAQIVRDGLVVDFHGAISLLRELKQNVEARLGFELTTAATTYPPGVPTSEVRATRYVVEAAGFQVEHVIDEPTAANAVLQIENGAVVDVGGGTTGVAIFRAGEVVYTADEPTGGTHVSLVIAGALGLEFEQAEALKKDDSQHRRLFPLVRPVMEKMGTIVARHIAGQPVETIYLVGGTACFSGIDRVIQEVTGIPTVIPGHPLFVTPLGVAMQDT